MSRRMATPYLEWAKLEPPGRYNLAASGVPHAGLDDIGGSPHMPLAGPNGYGYQPLLARIAAHHGVTPSQVVTTTGCSMANYLALASLVEPGDEVLIERPVYEPLLLAAAHLGASIVRFERRAEHDFRLDPADVIRALTDRTRVVAITNLHNPTSELAPDEVLSEIGEAAARVGARVLVDEVYLDAVFEATPRSCVHLGSSFISTSSLTKVYGLSSLRCGWILADENLARTAWRLNDLIENARPFVPDWLAARAFDHLDGLRARARTLLDENRRVFRQWAEGRDDVTCPVPAWGTTVCVRPATANVPAFCERLRRVHDVTVVPGHFFELPAYIRIGLCAEPGTLREGLARLGECLTEA